MKISRKLLAAALSFSAIQLLPGVGIQTHSQASEIASTYTTCYFRSGTTETWKWGLQPNDAWYEMAGTWEKRRHTGTEYFRPSSDTSSAAIIQSCYDSQDDYGVSGTLIGVYAANSSAGNNYEIRMASSNRPDGVELLPEIPEELTPEQLSELLPPWLRP